MTSWDTLKEFLAAEYRAHDEIAASCAGRELAATRYEQGGIAQGLKMALDKVRELEKDS